MAHKKKMWEKEYSKHVGAVLLLIFSFCALALMSVGTPLGVLMDRNVDKRCHTLWGIRPNCWNADYEWRIEQDDCPDRRHRWEVAEAFSIIALFGILFVVGMAWHQLDGGNIKLVTLLTAIFACGSTCVPWAVVAAFYHTDFCGETYLTRAGQKLGIGFILMVVSFALQCIGILLFMFLEP